MSKRRSDATELRSLRAKIGYARRQARLDWKRAGLRRDTIGGHKAYAVLGALTRLLKRPRKG